MRFGGNVCVLIQVWLVLGGEKKVYPKIGFLSLRLANWGEQIWTLRQFPAMQAERNGGQRLEVAALFPCAMHNDACRMGVCSSSPVTAAILL